jgi:hypothetical protein
LVLNAGNPGASYLWQNGQTTQTFTIRQAGLYHVAVAQDGCIKKDSITISSLVSPAISISGDTIICKQGKTNLTAKGANLYNWYPTTGLSSTTGPSITASPLITTKYFVIGVSQNGCNATDSVTISVAPRPVFSAQTSKPVLCVGDTATLTAAGGDVYSWSPASAVSSSSGNIIQAYPIVSTKYKVVIENHSCQVKDSLWIHLPVASKPRVTTTKSNDISCMVGQARLSTGGGDHCLWRPSSGLSDSTSSSPTVSINNTTSYHVFITTTEGCMV